MSALNGVRRGWMLLRVVLVAILVLASVSSAVAATSGDPGGKGGASARSAPMRDIVSGKAGTTPEYKGDELIVRYESGASTAQRRAADKKAGGESPAKLGKHVPGLTRVKLKKGVSVQEAIAAYEAQPGVLYAEPNYQGGIDALPDDERFDELWGLNNTGQFDGVEDADIDAPEAWDTTTGSSDVLVAVIDTGVDYTHPELAPNMWTNPGEIPDNAIDDDLNGYVDDVYGIDTYNGDADPFDDHSHGTHCAGTIGAVGNNALGVAGVNWDVTIMAVKWIGADGMGWTDGAIEAIEYAYAMGADLSSNSWHVFEYSQALYDTIAALDKLIVFAAGNESSDTDVWVNHPSSYDIPNILAVGASNRMDEVAGFSNFGPKSVDLFAPGEDILSTVPGEGYDIYSGTSMATPHVAGVAALLLAEQPDLGWRDLKLTLMGGGDPRDAFAGQCLSGSRLNADVALKTLGLQPGTVTGTVTDRAGAPLEGVTVAVDSTLYATTATDGTYTIEGVVPGAHAVVFSHPDYLTFIAAGITVEAAATQVVDAELALAGKVSGTVTALDGGAPLEGIQVTVIATVDDMWVPAATGFTAADGTYTLGGLSAGTYIVEFFDGTATYIPQFYNGKATPEEADPVDVSEGVTTTGIDAALQEYGHIAGTVTAAETGEPVPDVWVSAYRDMGDWWEQVSGAPTGPDGTYDIPGLPEGAYRVEFWEGTGTFALQYYQGVSRLEEGADVNVALGETTSGIDAALNPAGHIAGTVTAADTREPIAGAWVNVYRMQDDSWQPFWGAETQEDGTFDVGGLPTGEYLVEFYEPTGNYIPEYYNGRWSMERADMVAVVEGSVTTGISASLDPAGRVSGTVTAADTGEPLPMCSITMWKRVSGTWEPVMWGETGEDGTYSVGGLTPGKYRVEFMEYSGTYLGEFYDDEAVLRRAQYVDVSVGSSIEGIDAELGLAGHITGTVTGPEGEPVVEAWITAYRRAGAGYEPVWGTMTDENGAYDIGALRNGRYRLEVTDNSGTYAFEYYKDATSLATATSIRAVEGLVRSGFDVQLDYAGTISGTVTDEATGEPIEWAYVSAYRLERREWVPVPTYGADTMPDGTYTLGGLPTGTYRVEFIAPWEGYATEYYDNQRSLRRATSISVIAGADTPGIDAGLTWVGDTWSLARSTSVAAPAKPPAQVASAMPDTSARKRILTIHGATAVPGFWPAAWVER